MMKKFQSTNGFKIASYLGFGFLGIILLDFLFLAIVQGTWTAWIPAVILLFLPRIIFWSSLIIHLIIMIQSIHQEAGLVNNKLKIGYAILILLTIISIFAYPLMGISIRKLFFM